MYDCIPQEHHILLDLLFSQVPDFRQLSDCIMAYIMAITVREIYRDREKRREEGEREYSVGERREKKEKREERI